MTETLDEIRADQIPIECMDCGRRRIGRRLDDAPVEAVLYRAHCGCKVPHVVGAGVPYYVDANGARIKWAH